MIIFNFDVLAKPDIELGARLPDPEGMRLWNMFYQQNYGRLAVVVDEDVNISIFEHWLKVNGVKAALYEVLDTTNPQTKAEKVHKLAMLHGRSDWYIDNDPDTCAITLRLGIPTLFVANPYTVRPEWSGIKRARPWTELVDEVNHQAEMRAERTWGDGPQRYDEREQL